MGAHPGLGEAFDVEVHPNDGQRRTRRVLAEHTWLAARTAGLAVHHLGGRIPARTSRPVAVTSHDLQPLDHPENFGPVKGAYLARAVPRSVARADVVVDNSGSLEDLVAQVDRVQVWLDALDRPPLDQPVNRIGSHSESG